MMNEFLKQIRLNKISSVEVADALGKSGVIENIRPINKRKYIAGQVFYVCTWSQTNWPLHEQIQQAPAGAVVYVDTYKCGKRAVLGDIVCKQLFTYQRIEGLVVNGFVRDAHRLIKEDYSIWCQGVTPLGCSNINLSPDTEIISYMNDQMQRFANSLIIADDSGVTFVEESKLNSKLMEALKHIELQEDIWYYCLDTLKMNSFEIICLKKYLEENELLPSALKARITSLETK